MKGFVYVYTPFIVWIHIPAVRDAYYAVVCAYVECNILNVQQCITYTSPSIYMCINYQLKIRSTCYYFWYKNTFSKTYILSISIHYTSY